MEGREWLTTKKPMRSSTMMEAQLYGKPMISKFNNVALVVMEEANDFKERKGAKDIYEIIWLRRKHKNMRYLTSQKRRFYQRNNLKITDPTWHVRLHVDRAGWRPRVYSHELHPLRVCRSNRSVGDELGRRQAMDWIRCSVYPSNVTDIMSFAVYMKREKKGQSSLQEGPSTIATMVAGSCGYSRVKYTSPRKMITSKMVLTGYWDDSPRLLTNNFPISSVTTLLLTKAKNKVQIRATVLFRPKCKADIDPSTITSHADSV